MKAFDLPIFWVLLCVLIAVTFTWIVAHSTVAKECRTLGAFYVGNSVFECKEKKT